LLPAACVGNLLLDHPTRSSAIAISANDAIAWCFFFEQYLRARFAHDKKLKWLASLIST